MSSHSGTMILWPWHAHICMWPTYIILHTSFKNHESHKSIPYIVCSWRNQTCPGIIPYFNVTVVTITHTRRSGGVLSRLSDSSCLLNSRFEVELKVWVQQESAVWWYKSVLQCGNSVGISAHTEVAFGQSIVWLYIILQHCALLPLQCNNIYATEWHASTLHSIICCAVFAK